MRKRVHTFHGAGQEVRSHSVLRIRNGSKMHRDENIC